MRKGKTTYPSNNNIIQQEEQALVEEIIRDASDQTLTGPTLDLFSRWIVDEDKADLKDEVWQDIFAKDCWEENRTPDESSYELLSHLWLRLGLDESEFPLRGVRGPVSVRATGGANRQGSGKRPRPLWLKPAMRVAAVFIPVAVVVLGALMIFNRPAVDVMSPVALTVLEVPDTVGAQGRTSLCDGSEIFVRPGGRIAYAVDFGAGDTRRVELTGEAYFDVAKDSDRKFVVETDALDITVLGTTFYVQAVEGASHTVVSLYTGRVYVQRVVVSDGKRRIDDASDAITMEQGQRLIWDNVTDEYTIEKIADERPDWITARLTFKQASLREVLSTFEWYYGIRVDVQGKIREDNQFTFTVRGTDDLEQIAGLLEHMAPGVRVTIQGDTMRVNVEQMEEP